MFALIGLNELRLYISVFSKEIENYFPISSIYLFIWFHGIAILYIYYTVPSSKVLERQGKILLIFYTLNVHMVLRSKDENEMMSSEFHLIT